MSRLESSVLDAWDSALESWLRERLDDVEAALEKAVRSDTDLVTQASSYLVEAGGKRFRPMLTLLCGRFGDASDQRLIQGALAIEIVHIATLYHDDVIDEADLRRGRPSVQSKWSNKVAILAGDFLFAKASEISSDLGTDVSRLLARTISMLCDGEIREVDALGRLDQTEAAYIEIIKRKTAALIATSCRLGGMLSEAPLDVIDRLEDYGMALGMAFQLSDDIMDVVSTERDLLKAPGQDLREGVYTLPVLHALRQGERAAELASILSGGPPQDDGAIRGALAIVREDATLVPARAAVEEYVGRAIDLAQGLAPGLARDAMTQLPRFLAARCGAVA